MNRFPVQVWGPTYQDRSVEYSAQTTINLFPARPAEGRSIMALHSWPGAKGWSTGTGADRGMAEMAGVLYKVSGETLYSVDASGAQTSIGTIVGGGRCNLQSDGTNLIISTGVARYQYNGTALTLISDADHEAGNTAAFLNRQMIYDGAGGRFWVADVDDPDSINALNFGTAESHPDDSMAVHVFRSMLRVFGAKSMEPWFNDGSTTNPPFSRVDSAVRPTGLGAIHSIANDDTYIYFVSSDRQIYRGIDIDLERITPVQMEQFLEEEEISDCYGVCISYAAQWFYALTFPEAGKTWMIPASDPANPFQLSTGLERGRHLMNSYCYCYGKHLVADYRNGNIYEWSPTTYTDNGEPILRERTLGPVNAEVLGLTGQEITMSRMEYIMETGVGNPDALDPVVQLDISYDGGKSFTNERWRQIGQAGEKVVVRHDSMRTFKDAAPRIRCTEPVNVSLHSAVLHAKLAGKVR